MMSPYQEAFAKAMAIAGDTDSFQLLAVAPPYMEARSITSVAQRLRFERGTVLMIDILALHAETALGKMLRELRASTYCPLAFRLQHGYNDVRLCVWGYLHGIRAFLAHGQPLRPTLWRQLTNPIDLAGDWLGWLLMQRPVDAHCARLIELIVANAPSYRRLSDLLGSVGLAARTVRYHFRKAGLPKAGAWFHAARLLYAQLELQRDPELPLELIAMDLGYSESRSFSNQFYRTFGVRPETTRHLLGLEWRIRAWWDRLQP